MDKKYNASNLFTDSKLDESLYAVLKLFKNSSVSVANIDSQEKVYRKQTDLVLDMAKPLLFRMNKNKFKKNSSGALALKVLTFLLCHLFKDISAARRLNILSQVHPNHVGLHYRSTESLPIGGDDSFGDSFIKKLLAQVQTAALVNNSHHSFCYIHSCKVQSTPSSCPKLFQSASTASRQQPACYILPFSTILFTGRLLLGYQLSDWTGTAISSLFCFYSPTVLPVPSTHV